MLLWLLVQGYESFIAVFYVLAAVVLVSLTLTVWVAVILKKDETGSVWLRRWVRRGGGGSRIAHTRAAGTTSSPASLTAAYQQPWQC